MECTATSKSSLSPVCCCYWGRTALLAATATYSCKSTIPDHGGGRDGAAEDRRNQYMLVFQDFLTKWPLAGESLVTFA